MARLMIGAALIPAVASLPQGSIQDLINTQLYHANWRGLTWVDFSTAAYIMSVGLSISISFPKYLSNGTSHLNLYKKMLKRSLILFLIGFIYNGGFSHQWPDIRITGVLQRVAICYFIGGILFIHMNTKKRFALIIGILLSYWAILAFIKVPGAESGIYTVEGNLAAYIDSIYLPGKAHYGTWDPEGILTTLPAMANCLIGMLWGDILLSRIKPTQKALFLIIGGVVAFNLAWIWNPILPIIKGMWTSSYSLATAGIGSTIIGFFYLIADIWKKQTLLFPLVVIGQNLLIAYIICNKIPLDSFVQRFVGGDVAYLLGAEGPFIASLTKSAFIWLFLYWLYKKNIIIKV